MRDKLTLLDAMVLVAAAALGLWGAAAYKTGFPLPLIARPGIPLLPLLLSVPVAVALTWGLLAVPVRTLRERSRQIGRQPGTALCTAAAASTLAVALRWLLRAWFSPYVDGSAWIYGAQVIYQCATTCGLGVVASVAPLTMAGRLHRPKSWSEWLRLALAGYWMAMFLGFSVL